MPDSGCARCAKPKRSSQPSQLRANQHHQQNNLAWVFGRQLIVEAIKLVALSQPGFYLRKGQYLGDGKRDGRGLLPGFRPGGEERENFGSR
jgi:hypothetical protein